MKKTARFIATLFAVVAMLASLVSCASEKPNNSPAASVPPAANTPAPTPEPTPEAKPTEQPGNEPDSNAPNVKYVFFGGELDPAAGGSAAKVELFEDGSAKAVDGYFGADGVTLHATYNAETGTWTEDSESITINMTGKLETTTATYTGTKADGVAFTMDGESFQLSYQSDANAFVTPDLGESGGSGVLLQFNEDGTAVATYGYIGGDGVTLYAEYSVENGAWTEEDGTYTFSMEEVSTVEMNDTFTASANDGFTFTIGDGSYEMALAAE